MKKILYLITLCCFLLGGQNIFAQGTTCGTAEALCDPSASFAAATGQSSLGAIPDCSGAGNCSSNCSLFSNPNPAFYSFQISESGDLEITISNSADEDIDFAVWGPYADFNAASASCGTGYPESSPGTTETPINDNCTALGLSVYADYGIANVALSEHWRVYPNDDNLQQLKDMISEDNLHFHYS